MVQQPGVLAILIKGVAMEEWPVGLSGAGARENGGCGIGVLHTQPPAEIPHRQGEHWDRWMSHTLLCEKSADFGCKNKQLEEITEKKPQSGVEY